MKQYLVFKTVRIYSIHICFCMQYAKIHRLRKTKNALLFTVYLWRACLSGEICEDDREKIHEEM
jgi:hypothetical protein